MGNVSRCVLFFVVRTVPLNAKKETCGFKFTGYGGHIDNYPYPYLCMASVAARLRLPRHTRG
eukprot:TRINITY_DN7746_c0_g1_i1.p1 TRINITY_DN7746_c0_g1~~TRINITY_DN7746_c0_g1_i1.p1  ORF type:complete len:62 (+),score=3.15 TRINITY_DN7746_c0_g1_i1:269-454(+)